MDDNTRQPLTAPLQDLTGASRGSDAATPVPFREGEFLDQLASVARPLLDLGAPSVSGRDPANESRRQYRAYADRALDLEIFLDECNAPRNATFAPLREYVASVRGFAKTGQHLAHLVKRTGQDLPKPSGKHAVPFVKETLATLEFARRSLATLWNEAAAELRRLCAGERLAAQPGSAPAPEQLPARHRLPTTMDASSLPEQNRRIAELGAKFLGHWKTLQKRGGGERFDEPEAMREFVLEVSDEQQVRFFQTRIHNVLSAYDTFVSGTEIETADPELPRFRAYVAVVFVLLEAMTQLVHFYERHENDIRSEQAKDRVAQLVDKHQVLDRILNYALFFVHRLMEDAAPLAEGFVARYTTHAQVVCRLPAGTHLHARPVSLISRIVQHHGTPVTMSIGTSTCYAGSILQMLIAAGANTQVRELQFSGDRHTLEDLKLLFAHGLGEQGKGSLPPELAYLES